MTIFDYLKYPDPYDKDFLLVKENYPEIIRHWYDTPRADHHEDDEKQLIELLQKWNTNECEVRYRK